MQLIQNILFMILVINEICKFLQAYILFLNYLHCFWSLQSKFYICLSFIKFYWHILTFWLWMILFLELGTLRPSVIYLYQSLGQQMETIIGVFNKKEIWNKHSCLQTFWKDLRNMLNSEEPTYDRHSSKVRKERR